MLRRQPTQHKERLPDLTMRSLEIVLKGAMHPLSNIKELVTQHNTSLTCTTTRTCTPQRHAYHENVFHAVPSHSNHSYGACTLKKRACHEYMLATIPCTVKRHLDNRYSIYLSIKIIPRDHPGKLQECFWKPLEGLQRKLFRAPPKSFQHPLSHSKVTH